MAVTKEQSNITEKAVKQLRAYAKYMYDNAEAIIGNIDKPNYVTEGGIDLSFTLLERNSVPVIRFSKECIVLDALEVD